MQQQIDQHSVNPEYKKMYGQVADTT